MKDLNWKKRLVASSVLAGAFAAIVAPAAFAQGAEEETVETVPAEDASVEEEARQETILVTGSRIARSGAELTQPTEIVGSDFIETRSLTNAADAVLQIPGVTGVTPQLANNDGGASSGVGQNVVSLFNLGSQRTLTLIDGRRFVSSNAPAGGAAAPGSQVDLNNIPLGLIDRVEVVKVGGAAVYGADAVAGVVNYIMKRDFEGVELSADYRTYGGSTFDNYAEEISVRGLMGGNFDNGRGNVVLALEFNDLPSIPRADVPSRAEQWSSFTPLGDQRVLRADGSFPANQVRLIPQPRAGLLSVGGLITPGDLALTNFGIGAWDANGTDFIQFDKDGNGNIIPYDPGAPTDNAVWASGGDGLDLALTNTTQEGYQRFNTALLGTYQLTPDVRLTVDVYRNRTSATNEGYQLNYASGAFGGTSAAFLFDTSNPFLTPESRAAIEARAGGPTEFYLHKAWLDLGAYPITNENNVESYHLGFDGDFAALDRDWAWELNYQLGRSTVASSTRAPNDERWFAAMDVGINPDTGQLDCRFNYVDDYDLDLKAAGFGVVANESILGTVGSCAPYNPFISNNSQAAIDYISVNAMRFTELEQEIVSGYLSTESIVELPGGGVGLAVGFENRSETAKEEVDGTNSLGVSRNGLGSGAEGGYRSWDLYAETLIPVISADMGVPFLQQLDVESSYRKIESDRSGNDEAWAVGANIVTIPDLRFRANYAKTVRAPAVTELFLPQSLSSQFAADPCSSANLGNGPRPAVRQANCAAEGIPTNFVSLAGNASRRGTTGGNPNLDNEQATSVNFGLVFQPRFLDGFTLTADYTKIEITDAIVTFSLTNIMEACYDGTDFPNAFCSQFVRGPDFQLPATDAFTSGYVNAALREFDVVELAARYTNEIADIPFVGQVAGGRDLGTIDIVARAYNPQTDTISNTGVDRTDTIGQHNNPKWLGDLTVVHTIGRLTTFADIAYQGSGVRNVFQTEPLQYIDESGQPYTNVDSVMTIDLGAQYDLTDAISLRMNVTNVGDWYPDPVEISLGRGTYGSVWTIGATARF